MIGRLASVGLLAFLMMATAKQSHAQDNILGGAILGGAAGGIIGGAIGGGRGVVPGIIIGAAAGAIIANEGERRRGGRYYYKNSCYIRRNDGSYVAVNPADCDGSAAATTDDVAYCTQRFRSYDPGTGTYMGYDGARHPCP